MPFYEVQDCFTAGGRSGVGRFLHRSHGPPLNRPGNGGNRPFGAFDYPAHNIPLLLAHTVAWNSLPYMPFLARLLLVTGVFVYWYIGAVY
jgi:hypothetical protein